MASKKKTDKAIKVAELKSGEAGRGIVRLDPELMDVLNIKVGDIVKITDQKSTVAKVLRGGPEDANSGIIRMDGNTRWNAGTSIDDRVGGSSPAPIQPIIGERTSVHHSFL